jgi:hypothetical protein
MAHRKLNVRWRKSTKGPIWFLDCPDCGRCCGQLRQNGDGNYSWWVCVGTNHLTDAQSPGGLGDYERDGILKIHQRNAIAALKKLIALKRKDDADKLESILSEAKSLLQETLSKCIFCVCDSGGDCSEDNPCYGCELSDKIHKYLES